MTLVCSTCSAGGEFIIQATTTSVHEHSILSRFMTTSGYRPTLVHQNGKSQNLYTQN